jgi:AcrR family transcriptional regulator
MPKVTADYLEARRQHLLDAASKCFARNGFQDTTIKDIAAEAGVSYGIVYHYFQSKEEIIEASAARGLEARARRFALAEEHAADGVGEVLNTLLRLSLERWRSPGSTTSIRLRLKVLAEGLSNTRIRRTFEAGWADLMQRLLAIVRRGQASGEISSGIDPESIVRLILSLHEGLVFQKAWDPSTDVTRYIEAARALLRGQLFGQRRGDGHDGSR